MQREGESYSRNVKDPSVAISASTPSAKRDLSLLLIHICMYVVDAADAGEGGIFHHISTCCNGRSPGADVLKPAANTNQCSRTEHMLLAGAPPHSSTLWQKVSVLDAKHRPLSTAATAAGPKCRVVLINTQIPQRCESLANLPLPTLIPQNPDIVS